MTALCFLIYPELRMLFELPDRAILHAFWAYSSWVFIINICQQFIYYSDNLVVGAFVSVSAVTFYAIGGTLIEYLRALVTALTVTFTPLASSFEAEGRTEHLRKLLIQGTRAALLIGLPVALALMFRGKTFIGLWMGERYADMSSRVLQILLLCQLTIVGNATAGGIAYGVGKHNRLAYFVAAEGIANLTLSVVLVRYIGLLGAAWGTTIPSLVAGLFLLPPYCCRIVGITVREFFWQGWGRLMLAATPYGLACFLADHYWHPGNLATFFLQIALVLPVFVVGVLVVFWKEVWLKYGAHGLRNRDGK
jgi:O-antigen/teichoic acid export membrane protein